MIEARVPLPLQVVIDDVGWRIGRTGPPPEPFRTGVDRLHVPDDYRAIAHLGRRLNMRPQAAMILGEWDTTNRLAQIHSASWLGPRWDNSANTGPWIEESAQVIRDNRAHFEVTLHGLGHEFWSDGQLSRAEWHDAEGNPRPRDTIRAKLDLFFELHERHRLGDPPRSFVPCAFLHHFGRRGQSLAANLDEYGLTSISTPFTHMHRTRQPQTRRFGFDHGLITIDRGHDPCPWNQSDPRPQAIPDQPIIGMHWPNLLHPDPSRNLEVVERWVALLDPVGKRFDRVLSPHTEAFYAQLVYHVFAAVSVKADQIHVDARRCFDQPWKRTPDEPMTLKVRAEDGDIQVLSVPVSAQQPVVTLPISPKAEGRRGLQPS